MKRMLVVAAVATALGLVASDAKANGWGAAPVPAPFGAGPQAGPVAPQGDRYGYNPLLRQLMWWKKDRCGAQGYGGAAGGPGGTLVYPVNPYVRSPRDWFQN